MLRRNGPKINYIICAPSFHVRYYYTIWSVTQSITHLNTISIPGTTDRPPNTAPKAWLKKNVLNCLLQCAAIVHFRCSNTTHRGCTYYLRLLEMRIVQPRLLNPLHNGSSPKRVKELLHISVIEETIFFAATSNRECDMIHRDLFSNEKSPLAVFVISR